MYIYVIYFYIKLQIKISNIHDKFCSELSVILQKKTIM